MGGLGREVEIAFEGWAEDDWGVEGAPWGRPYKVAYPKPEERLKKIMNNLIRNEGRFKPTQRSTEHTSALQSLMRISYAVFCLKQKQQATNAIPTYTANNTQ